MANFDSRTYCNTVWNIFGTTKPVTKSGTSDPVFITKILQKIQEQYENILEHIFCNICESEILKVWESLCTIFEMLEFELLTSLTFEV